MAKSEHILVVGRSKAFLKTVRAGLSLKSFRLTEAKSVTAPEALTVISKKRTAFVVWDVDSAASQKECLAFLTSLNGRDPAPSLIALTPKAAPAFTRKIMAAGAAQVLGESILVNPWHLDATAEAIATALDMSPRERQRRMLPMVTRVEELDCKVWARRFLADLAGGARKIHADGPLL